MEKLYYHPSFYLAEDGKWKCSYCHKEISNNGMIPEPCVYPTAAQSVFDNYRFEISVWNCECSLCCFREEKGHRNYFKIDCSEEIKQKIDILMEDSIYDVGGAINISGIYPLNEKLENFLESKIKNGEIVLKPKIITNEYHK